MKDRISQIILALNYLNDCLEAQKRPDNDKLGCFMGEMDWRKELHRLLFQYEE